MVWLAHRGRHRPTALSGPRSSPRTNPADPLPPCRSVSAQAYSKVTLSDPLLHENYEHIWSAEGCAGGRSNLTVPFNENKVQLDKRQRND
eukprot:3818140-Rhodomonas_salina.2